MKIIDAVRNVKRPDPRYIWEFSAPIDALCEDFELDYIFDSHDKIDASLKAYPIFKWLCTDEMVGLDALYFNDAPVAAIFRECRKCHYEIMWLTPETASAVRDFLVSFLEPKEARLLDPLQEIDEVRMAYSADRPVVLEVEE